MLIDLAAPCTLPLGLVKLADQSYVLGLTLQHPPVQIFAEAAAHFSVTGGRADVGYPFAERYRKAHAVTAGAEVEIELSIPAHMGLGSAAMLGLSVAHALAWVHDRPPEDVAALAAAIELEPHYALQRWAFEHGELLLVEANGRAPAPARRFALAHPPEQAWAFVFHWPRLEDDLPNAFEEDLWAALFRAAPLVSADSGRVFEETLCPALERDDIAAFGRAMLMLDAMSRTALAQVGVTVSPVAETEAILEVMRTSGAVAWGRSLTGLLHYGLVCGAAASVVLRERLQNHVGLYGGNVMATIADNRGAQHQLRELRPPV